MNKRTNPAVLITGSPGCGKSTLVAVVHRNLVGQYRDKGRLFTLTRNNFEQVRAEILSDLKSWRT